MRQSIAGFRTNSQDIDPIREKSREFHQRKSEQMSTMAPPRIYNLRDRLVVEPGDDYAYLYESQLDELAILPLLAKSIEPARLVIDMSHVRFIGSASIGHFVRVAKTLSDRDGWLKLANLNKFCRAAIGVSKLDSILRCAASIEEAVGDE